MGSSMNTRSSKWGMWASSVGIRESLLISGGAKRSLDREVGGVDWEPVVQTRIRNRMRVIGGRERRMKG